MSDAATQIAFVQATWHRNIVDKAREGDHICYISDTGKMRRHYPGWSITKSLEACLSEMVDAWRERI